MQGAQILRNEVRLRRIAMTIRLRQGFDATGKMKRNPPEADRWTFYEAVNSDEQKNVDTMETWIYI